jgi:hypothetical protein
VSARDNLCSNLINLPRCYNLLTNLLQACFCEIFRVYTNIKQCIKSIYGYTGGILKMIITIVPNVAMSGGHVMLKELFDGLSVNIDGLSEPSVTHVPKYPPLTRQQYDEWSKLWPITFHEDKQ